MKNTWQNLPNEETEKLFETSLEFGLTEDKVTERSNKRKRKRKNIILCFLSQFGSLYHILLVLIAALLVCTGSAPEGILVLAALVVHSVYASICTMQFDSAMESAARMKMPELTVIRSGEERAILADRVVVGDVIKLEAGQRICFPVKITEDNGLVIIPENADDGYEISESDRQRSFAEAGQRIVFGSGKAVVADSEYVPPLIKKQSRVKVQDYVYLGTMAVFFLSAVIMLIYSLKGVNPLELMLSFVGLFLAICPLDMLSALKLCDMESLKKLNKNSTLTKEGAELLRNAERIVLSESDFVSDKLVLRGIITEYRDFDAKKEYIGDDNAVLKLLKSLAAICTEKEPGKVGSSIVRAAADSGIYKEILNEKYPYKFEVKNEDRYTVGIETEDGVRVITSGSLSSVMPLCTDILTEGKMSPISDEYKEKMNKKAEEMEKNGMYITALAFSDNKKETEGEKANLCLLGLFGSMLKPEPEKTETVLNFKKVQLKPLLITALSKEKALSATASAGLSAVLTKESVDDRTDSELEKILPDIEIISDATEDTKTRVLEIMKNCGTVAVCPVRTHEDMKAAENAGLKIALDDSPEWVQRQCGGSAGFMHQIPELKRDAVNTYRNKNNILRAFLVSKLGILVFALLCAAFTAKPLTFLQMLWVSMVILPVTNWFLQKKDANSRGISGKALVVDSVLWGVLFGVILMLAELMNASVFWTLTLGILIIGLQAGSGKVFIGGGFLSNRKALFSILCVFVATLIIQLIPKTSELFVLKALTFGSVILTLLCAGLLILGTDVLKYVQYIRGKKNVRNEN
ncbi:MAG: cation-transporting P-type ATPase [Clostridia bacterium]|nr:cation-transporting P-type ATPase [Clostridia bacterium]